MNEFTRPPKPFYKRTWFIVIAIMAGLGLLVSIIDPEETSVPDETKTDEKIKLATVEDVQEEEDEITLHKKLLQSYEALSNRKDFSNFREIKGQLYLEVDLFIYYWEMINEAKESGTDEEKALAEKLEVKSKQWQATEFAAMRKEYGRIAKQQFWVEDIEVYTSGKGHRVINFTGGVFSANRNILEFAKAAIPDLLAFRYNEVRFRWYDDAEEYTSYTLWKGGDTDPVKEIVLE